MAGPRQLVVRFATDLKNFVTERVSRGLEDVGEDAREASDRLERMGDSAEQAARELDNSFDRIRRASRSTGDDLRRVEDDAREGFDGVREEASQTGRETAASFDGTFESIGDGFQELAANAGASFGPVGLAVGVVAAGALGTFAMKAEAAKEEAASLGDAMQSVNSGASSMGEAVYEFLDALDVKRFQAWADAAEQAGVSVETYVEATLGSVEAQQAVTAGMADQERQGNSLSNWLRDFQSEIHARNQADADTMKNIPLLGAAQQWWTDLLGSGADVTAEYAEQERQKNEQLEAGRVAAEQSAEATDALKNVTSEAAESVSESYKDAEGNVVYSLDQIGAALDAQTEAARNYASNVASALQRGVSQEAVSYLMELPDGGRRAFQELNGATADQIAKLNGQVDNFHLAEDITEDIRNQKGPTAAAAGENVRAAEGVINNANLNANIRVTSSGAADVAATLARLTGDRTVRITASLVGGAAQYLQGSRRLS